MAKQNILKTVEVILTLNASGVTAGVNKVIADLAKLDPELAKQFNKTKRNKKQQQDLANNYATGGITDAELLAAAEEVQRKRDEAEKKAQEKSDAKKKREEDKRNKELSRQKKKEWIENNKKTSLEYVSQLLPEREDRNILRAMMRDQGMSYNQRGFIDIKGTPEGQELLKKAQAEVQRRKDEAAKPSKDAQGLLSDMKLKYQNTWNPLGDFVKKADQLDQDAKTLAKYGTTDPNKIAKYYSDRDKRDQKFQDGIKKREAAELQKTIDYYVNLDKFNEGVHKRKQNLLKLQEKIRKTEEQAETKRLAKEERQRLALRQQRYDKFSNNMYGGMTALASFGGATMGSIIGSMPGGSSVIGKPFMGALAGGGGGGGLGGSLGMMMGGPWGALAGGAIGTVIGAGVGFASGLIQGVVDIFTSGISTAIEYLVSGTKKVVALGMDYERSLMKFTVLTGSKEAGKNLYGSIEKLGMQTPYSVGSLSQNTEMLLGYGVSKDNIPSALSRLGEIAGGDAVRMQRLALAFGQVSSAGRLMGQELRQFSEAGVGAEDFALTYGKSVLQLKADMEAGIVPASVMVKTINRLTNEGGRFFGMNKEGLKTVSGQWQVFEGTIEKVGRRLGLALFQKTSAADVIGQGTNFIEKWISSGGIDKTADWIVTKLDAVIKFGGQLYNSLVTPLSLVVDLSVKMFDSLFGISDGFKYGESAWKTFERSMVNGVTFVSDLFAGLMDTILDLGPIFIRFGFQIANIAEDIGRLGSLRDPILKYTSNGVPFFGALVLAAGEQAFKKAQDGSHGLREMEIDALTSWTKLDNSLRGDKTLGDRKSIKQRAQEARDNWKKNGGVLDIPFTSINGLSSLTGSSNGLMGIAGAGIVAGGMKPTATASDISTAIQWFSPIFEQLSTDLGKKLKEGMTPLDEYQIKMKSIFDVQNMKDNADLIEQTLRQGLIPEEEIAAFRRKVDMVSQNEIDQMSFGAFSALNSKYGNKSDDFKSIGTIVKDSSEAVKAIYDSMNANSADNPQMQIKEVLEKAYKEQEKFNKNFEQFRSYIQTNGWPVIPKGFN